MLFHAETPGLGGLPGAESVLALCCKNVRDAAAVGLDDLLIQIHEGAVQLLCQQFADRGLAAGGHADEGNVQDVPAQSGSDAPDLGGGVLKFAVEEVFGGVHRLRHQHFQAAHGHRNAGFFGTEDQFGLVRVIHHVQHGFQPGHGGHIQIAHAYIGVHACRGGVDDDLRPAGNGLGIAQLALFRVGVAADGQDLCRALVVRHGAGGVVGAAGA